MNDEDDLPVYGELGVPTSINHPASRIDSATWTAPDGTLWLFGGGVKSPGVLNVRNDLWKYDLSTKQWTWVSGSQKFNDPGYFGAKGEVDPRICPPARSGGQGWIDADGNLWLYGGVNSEGYFLGDLWKYHRTQNQWEFVGGKKTFNDVPVAGTEGVESGDSHPGSRADFNTFVFNGKLYLFGGWMVDKVNSSINYYNDIWRFDPDTNSWTFLKGSSDHNSAGHSEGLGVSGANVLPGARCLAAAWTDKNNNFFIYGGSGINKSEDIAVLGDLWKYSPDTNEWTDVAGDKSGAIDAVYGIKGEADSQSYPGSLVGATAKMLEDGNVYLFGGTGPHVSSTPTNTLWKYDTSLEQWIWIKGGNAGDNAPFYGVFGTPSRLATPPGLANAVSWVTKDGEFVIFGGINTSDTNPKGMWRFGPDTIVNMAFQVPHDYTPDIINDSEDVTLSVDSVSTKGNVVVNGKTVNYTNILSHNNRVGHDIVTLGVTGAGCPRRTMKAHYFDYKNTQGLVVTNLAQTFLSTYIVNQPIRLNLGLENAPDANGLTMKFKYKPGGGPGPTSTVPYVRYDAPGDYNVSIYVDSVLDPGNGAVLAQTFIIVPAETEPSVPMEWTWVGGSDQLNPSPNYPGEGQETATATPGARKDALTWIGKDGSLWLFGGSDGNALKSDLWKYNRTTGMWSWVRGNQGDDLRTVIVPPTEDEMGSLPGARRNGYTWVDSEGNLWMFGGYGVGVSADADSVGYLSDLWKFDVRTLAWTFVRGELSANSDPVYNQNFLTPDVDAQPGGLSNGASAVSANGTFWLFGGETFDSAEPFRLSNQLWKYHPQLNIWQMVAGAEDFNQDGTYVGVPALIKPGSRRASALVNMDNTRLYLYGGFGYTNNDLNRGLINDLMQYDFSEGHFSVVAGNHTLDQDSIYPALGSTSVISTPGGRSQAKAWQNNDGVFTLWGGESIKDTETQSTLYKRDLWELEPTSSHWKWVAGDNLGSQPGVYTDQGNQSPTSVPGGRKGQASWVDETGRLWIYGGEGSGSGSGEGILGDLWRFSTPEPAANVEDWYLWD